MAGENPLQYLSNCQDLIDLNDFMQDKDFEDALELAMKCVANPNIGPATARKALVQMQAYAFKFKMVGVKFMTIDKGRAGTPENNKKNVYYSMSEQCHEMAQSLKYVCKETF